VGAKNKISQKSFFLMKLDLTPMSVIIEGWVKAKKVGLGMHNKTLKDVIS
jgi:hypothetical protein